MLFGRRKPGFHSDETPDQDIVEEKQDLLEYLESLPDVEDEFGDCEVTKVVSEEETELTEAQKLAGYIRLRTEGVLLTSEALLKDEVEEYEKLVEEMKRDESCEDIQIIKGQKDCYYYSNLHMSDNYAKIASLVEEKDLPLTIGEMVRFNCKTYPAPTPITYFIQSPYYATEPQVLRGIDVLLNKKEFEDIQVLTNNVGTKFLYSTEFMSLKYARALAKVDDYID